MYFLVDKGAVWAHLASKNMRGPPLMKNENSYYYIITLIGKYLIEPDWIYIAHFQLLLDPSAVSGVAFS